MKGVWISPQSKCQMSIVINKDMHATYQSNLLDLGCGSRPVKGKTRFTKTNLYIGITSFKFQTKPELTDGTDSIYGYLNYRPVKGRIIATMTLENSKLYSGEVIKYYKITDY